MNAFNLFKENQHYSWQEKNSKVKAAPRTGGAAFLIDRPFSKRVLYVKTRHEKLNKR